MSWGTPITFLKEHEGELWSPNEIAKALKSDIRTTKNRINANRLLPYYTSYRGWRLDVAERGKRIYAVRLMRDLEGSRARIKADISEVQGLPEENLEDIVGQKELILKHVGTGLHRDEFLRCLNETLLDPDSDVGRISHEKLTQVIQSIKKYKIDYIQKYQGGLGH